MNNHNSAVLAASVFAGLRFLAMLLIYHYGFGFSLLQAIGIAFLPNFLIERKIDWSQKD